MNFGQDCIFYYRLFVLKSSFRASFERLVVYNWEQVHFLIVFRWIVNRVADLCFVYACVLFLILIVYVRFYACVLVVIVHACLLFLILVFGYDVGNVYENGLGGGLVNFVQMKKRKFLFSRSEIMVYVMLIFSKELVLVQLHPMYKVFVALYLRSNCLNCFGKKQEVSVVFFGCWSFFFFLLFCHVFFLWFFHWNLTSFFCLFSCEQFPEIGLRWKKNKNKNRVN